MITDFPALKSFLAIPRGFRRWALAAAFVAGAICSLPGEGRAAVSYGVLYTHQQNDVNNPDSSSSTTQDRYSVFFNVLAAPTSKLSMTGLLRFDILRNNGLGGESTEFQPNVDIRLAARSAQLGFGYREIIRDEAVLAGVSTSNRTSDDKDAYVDTSVSAGRLPSLRLRYSYRDEQQHSDGVPLQNSVTNDITAGMNYRLGIFTMNADYRYETTRDSVTGVTGNTTVVTGQAGAAKQFGPRLNMSLRENYNLSLANANGVQSGNSYTSISEARGNFNPLAGVALSTNYIYRVSNDLLAEAGKTTEKTWFSSVNYNISRALRVYGSYNRRDQDGQDTTTSDNTAIWGVGFGRGFGSRVSLTSRYEGQSETITTTTDGTATSNSSHLRTNIDWTLSARLANFISMALGESYVSNTVSGLTSSSNRFRVSAAIGPLRNLTLAPSLDYAIDTGTEGAQTTITQLVLPAAFRVSLHGKVDFSISDDYRWTRNEDATGGATTSSSNNLTLRLTILRPLPGTTVSGDATFSTNTSGNSQTTTQSTYAARASWAYRVHAFNVNARYQTGTNTGSATVSSADFSAQYGLNFRLKNLAVNLQARYDYTSTFSTSSSNSQGVFISLNARR